MDTVVSQSRIFGSLSARLAHIQHSVHHQSTVRRSFVHLVFNLEVLAKQENPVRWGWHRDLQDGFTPAHRHWGLMVNSLITAIYFFHAHFERISQLYR